MSDKKTAEQIAAEEKLAAEAKAKETRDPSLGKDPEPFVVEGKYVNTVYGDMVDASTGELYTQAPTRYKELTPWMQSQIEHGKMQFSNMD